MKRYDSYKDSGFEWIGEIPSHWERLNLGNVFTVKGRIGWKNLRSDEYIEEPNYIFLSTPNLKSKEIDFIVEDNKLKQGKFIPGVKIPIKSKSLIKDKDNHLHI